MEIELSPGTRNLLLVLSGLMFVLFGIWIILRARKFKRRRSAQTVATAREVSMYGGESRLVYVYTVNGKEYSYIWTPNDFRSYNSLQKMVGQQATVFYNPDDPDISQLYTNNEYHIIWQMLVSIVCGIGLMAWGFYSIFTGR